MEEMDDTECANPQFLAWVREWLDLAKERNSKGVTTYKHAYDSLKACPIAFQHPAELQRLKGFGPKLCERLEDLLKKHCASNGLSMPEHPRTRQAAERAAGNGDGTQATEKRAPKKARKPKSYVPAFRSGGYAIVLGLSSLSESSSAGMTKAELIQVAQPHCDASFSAPSDPTKFYTAWNTMKTLLQKELVYERRGPLRRYSLTDEGWEVARRIKDTDQWQGENSGISSHFNAGSGPIDTRPQSQPSLIPDHAAGDSGPGLDVVANGSSIEGDQSLPSFAAIKLPPGSFTVQMVLDTREVRAKTDRDYMREELAKQGVTPIMRSLGVGDIQWVAKCHDAGILTRHGAEGDEVVLDWVVERKRLDDLIGSIKDGRFHEQKFRLKRSGVRKVIYIIEDISMDSTSFQRYEEAVQSAVASTQAVNGYFVKKTTKMDDTIKYLARMTAMLKRTYEGKYLSVIPTKVLTAQNYMPLLTHLRRNEPSTQYYVTYAAFSSMASKSDMMTLRDVFLKMLMTTRGVTGERALEIQKRWKTPREFVKAFETCGPGEIGKKRKRELVSSRMAKLVGRKKVAKQLSQRIAEVWGDA